MDDNNNIKRSPNVPPFVRYCSAIIPTMFDDSLSYYEALCALNNFIQKNIVEVINNNGQVTEEYIKLANDLKEYVDNYFDNLDVQEEINNKLDEMAGDGTLATLINIDSINQKLSIIPEMFVECTLVKNLGKPTSAGARPQSMAFDGTYWYVVYTNSADNMIVWKFNSDFSIKVAEQQLSVNGHANSCSYFNGKLYICNYNSNYDINVVDCTTLSVVDTITVDNACRGFAIGMTTDSHRIFTAIETYTSGQVRFFEYLPDGNMQFLCSVQSEYSYTYRNGCKFITDSINNNRFLFGSVIANDYLGTHLNAHKGNTIEFTIPATDRRLKVGLLGSGYEVQDFDHPVANSNTYYIIDNDANIYTADINLFTSTTSLPAMGGSTQTLNNVYLYTGHKDKMKEIATYDSFVSGQSSFDVCTSFLIPRNLTRVEGAFQINSMSKAVASEWTATNTRPGKLYVPVKKTHSYNGTLYEIDGHLCYNSSDYTATNVAGQSETVIKYSLGNNTDVRIKETDLSTGTITFNRYQTYSSLATRITTDGIGFVLADVYPIVLRCAGQCPNGDWEYHSAAAVFGE